MSIVTKKNIFHSSLFIVVVLISLSAFASVPYIYSACAFSVWAAIGHLVTLDDDMPGEWSNMEGSSEVWRKSCIQLAVKLGVMLALITVTMAYPELRKYGA
jgi:NADH:ubiquinone oxidoreductase subunit 6 (subunit J)